VVTSAQGLEDLDLELIDGPVLEAASELAAVVLVEALGQRVSEPVAA
jgi:hypothetical protein